MNWSLMLGSGHEGLDAMACLKYGISMKAQGFLYETANRRFVFHKQDGLPPMYRFCDVERSSCDTLLDKREIYFERRALFFLTFDHDASAALFDDPVNG